VQMMNGLQQMFAREAFNLEHLNFYLFALLSSTPSSSC